MTRQSEANCNTPNEVAHQTMQNESWAAAFYDATCNADERIATQQKMLQSKKAGIIATC